MSREDENPAIRVIKALVLVGWKFCSGSNAVVAEEV
jgi:hypothetical protein